jgi:hypothetical protein
VPRTEASDSATEAILKIYGEVDRAVQEDPLARVRVSQLLPEYQTPGVHWYDDFLKWQQEARGASQPEAPSEPEVAQALNAITAKHLKASQGRLRARLMFATAVATRAFPEMTEADTEHGRGAIHALSQIAPEQEEPFATELLKLLSRDRPAGKLWEPVVELLKSRGIDTIGIEPKPCAARLVTVPGIDGPAAALSTYFETEALSFKDATKCLAPVNWKTCRGDFWCRMEEETDPPKLPPGQRRYHEVVSSNCNAQPQALFWAETRLLFNFIWIPTKAEAQAAVANYELADQPPRPSDLIQVDEGSLVVSRLPYRPTGGSNTGRKEKLGITTTKRIKFNYPFSSQALALIVCALGWLDTGAQLVACAAAKGKDLTEATDFAGEPASAALEPRGEPAPRSPGGLFQEGVDIWARALRDGAAALEGNLGSGPEGSKKTPPRSGS